MHCLEGHEKKDASSGNYMCEANGKWSGEETICVLKDCGAIVNQVLKAKEEYNQKCLK